MATDTTTWTQVNLAWPGDDRLQRERAAVAHLAAVLPRAETAGLIDGWWFMRKGPWRIRYHLCPGVDDDPVRPQLTAHVAYTGDHYEPETHAFGGADGMSLAHTLFHSDSAHLLRYLPILPPNRNAHALVLCTALMRGAGLDPGEQGDVWANLADQRATHPDLPTPPDHQTWVQFVSHVRRLVLETVRPSAIEPAWVEAFRTTGMALRTLRDTGALTTGIRAILGMHVKFHLNRLGVSGVQQEPLARAAAGLLLGRPPA